MTSATMPTYKELLWPTLKALEATGGSASIEELSDQVAVILNLSDDIQDIPHKDGPRSEVDYRAAWARKHLKAISAVNNIVDRLGSVGKVITRDIRAMADDPHAALNYAENM